MTDMLNTLNQLESELSEKKGLFSKKVDLDRCAELVAVLKSEIPSSLSEARQILATRQRILENADSAAQNTIREAEERASHIVENSELLKAAQNESHKIIDQGLAQCDKLVERTKTHLDEMFKDIEQFLLSTLAMIRNNREELRGAMILNPKK
jgi:F0F1-type ATP synthase membrane subunit b/b'